MANKNFNTRIQLKSDTEANWDKATNFIPLKGETIIYSADSAHPFSRLKVGDGVTVVSELPFVGGESQSNAVTGVKGNSESDYRTGNVNITPANLGLGNVDNTSDLDKPISTATQEALDEKVDVVEGKGLSSEDYTSVEKTKLANIEAGAQVNTIIGVKGDSESEYRTGNVNITKANIGLSSVDNTSDANKPISTATQTALNNKISTSLKGAASGVAELDENGKVPTSQLPSFVDDVVEYSSSSNFPLEGEAGKIYVDTLDNKTYRWSGSGYVEISPSIALGETSATAYRGDRGKTAYDHASAKGSAFSSGLYKITTNSEGHVTGATAVTKDDITALGIPGSDTNTNTTYTLTQDSSDGHKLTFTGSDGTSKTFTIPDNNTTYTLSSLGIGDVKNYDQSKAIKSITRNGTTFTYTCLDNTTGTFTQQDSNTTYSSLAAASGGTDVSLVTTGEKATWNAKTSNTGTVTKVSTGAGLTGGDITTTGTVKANLTSETKLTNAAADGTETAGRVYPVRLDTNGKLAVNVPWSNTTALTSMTGTLGIDHGGTGSTTATNALNALAFLGTNPTGGIENDTLAFWRDLGTGYAFFYQLGQLNGQPHRLGLLINYVYGQEVYQEFWVRELNAHYHRFNIPDVTAMPSWTPNDTTYSNATTSAAGLMSAADKAKLDNMQSQIDQWKSYTQALRDAMQGYIDNLPEAPGELVTP